MLPEVLDLGSRALRERLNRSSIPSVFSGQFDGASDSLDNPDEASSLLNSPTPSKNRQFEKLGNNHRVADVCYFFNFSFLTAPSYDTFNDDESEPLDMSIIHQTRDLMPNSIARDPDIKNIIKRRPGKIKKFLSKIKWRLGQVSTPSALIMISFC
jgi:hypothetical protein